MYSGCVTQQKKKFLKGNNILSQNKVNTTTSSLSMNKTFSFGSHQSFPLRYGWIEKFCDNLMEKYQKTEVIPREELAPETLCLNYGLGSNMAKSIRFWLKACGIIEDSIKSKKDSKFTNFACKIFGVDGDDKFLENKETIWRLHYNLVTNEDVTTWFWFFNKFKKQTFDRQQLVNDLYEASSKSYNEINIKRDVDCFIRSYAGTSSSNLNENEDALECPFIELNLIRKAFGNTLVAKRGEQNSLPDDLFLLSVIECWMSQGSKTSTITVETLLNQPKSPGCIFLLNRDSLIERLENIHKLSKETISLDQSSGLAQIIINQDGIDTVYKDICLKFKNRDENE